MPPDHARHLLAELRMHPISPAIVEERVAALDIIPSEAEIKETTKFHEHRRSQLMALLKKAIDLGEPLILSG
jgi:hypothetical protein